MPCELTANRGVKRRALVDSQVQGNDAVAAALVSSSKDVGHSGTLGEAVLIPVEAAASLSDGVARAAVVDSNDDGVASEDTRNRARSGDRYLRVAVGDEDGVATGVVHNLRNILAGKHVRGLLEDDGQQADGAVATVLVGTNQGVIIGSSHGDVVAVPVEAAIGNGEGIANTAAADRQVQRVRSVDIGAATGERHVMPDVDVTGSHFLNRALGDSQVQRDDAVAAILVATLEGVVDGHRLVQTGVLIPIVVATGGNKDILMVGAVDGESQCIVAIAEHSATGVGLTVLLPHIAVTGNSLGGGAIVHDEVQCNNAVATVAVDADEGMVDSGIGSHSEMLIPVEAAASTGDGVAVRGTVDGEYQGVMIDAIDSTARVGVTVPTIALASGSLGGGAREDRQVQRHDAVAARLVVVGEVVGDSGVDCQSGMFVPVEAATNLGDGVAKVAAIDSQVQRIVANDIGTAGIVDGTVPLVAVASNGVGGGALVHGQIQCSDTVASSSICGGVGNIVDGAGVDGTVPLVAVASTHNLDAARTTVDGENQRVVAESVDSARGQKQVVPLVAVASGNLLRRALVHRQVQRRDAVATSHIFGGVGSNDGFSVEISVPLIAVAGSGNFDAGGAAVDCQHQGIVAIGECATVGVRNTMPDVAVAGRNLGRRALVDGQVQRNGAVAAVGVHRGIGGSVGSSEELSTVPDIAVAGAHHLAASSALVDGQLESVHAGATGLIGVAVGVAAADAVRSVVPGVAVASCLSVEVIRGVVHRQVENVGCLHILADHGVHIDARLSVGLAAEFPWEGTADGLVEHHSVVHNVAGTRSEDKLDGVVGIVVDTEVVSCNVFFNGTRHKLVGGCGVSIEIQRLPVDNDLMELATVPGNLILVSPLIRDTVEGSAVGPAFIIIIGNRSVSAPEFTGDSTSVVAQGDAVRSSRGPEATPIVPPAAILTEHLHNHCIMSIHLQAGELVANVGVVGGNVDSGVVAAEGEAVGVELVVQAVGHLIGVGTHSGNPVHPGRRVKRIGHMHIVHAVAARLVIVRTIDHIQCVVSTVVRDAHIIDNVSAAAHSFIDLDIVEGKRFSVEGNAYHSTELTGYVIILTLRRHERRQLVTPTFTLIHNRRIVVDSHLIGVIPQVTVACHVYRHFLNRDQMQLLCTVATVAARRRVRVVSRLGVHLAVPHNRIAVEDNRRVNPLAVVDRQVQDVTHIGGIVPTVHNIGTRLAIVIPLLIIVIVARRHCLRLSIQNLQM